MSSDAWGPHPGGPGAAAGERRTVGGPGGLMGSLENAGPGATGSDAAALPAGDEGGFGIVGPMVSPFSPVDAAVGPPVRSGVDSAPGERLASALVALGTASLLGVARWLDPNPAGHSTHRQLGLPPCTFFDLTGIPCPMCGGTTTFALIADGRFVEGFWTQPFAATLFVGTVATLALSVSEVVFPRGRWSRLSAKLLPYELCLAGGFALAMSVGWIYKISVVLTQVR